jgi:hypothetical protein
MLSINCPSCGAAVNFQSKASVFAVCSFCKSTLVRQDMNLELVGKMADLQDDLTPFQIGTNGMFSKARFELVGRLRIAYNDGFWNEWYAIFGDGTEGWLAEAQGFLGFCLPIVDWQPPESGALFCGSKVTIGSIGAFEVEDLHKVRCIYSEGELPMNAVAGRHSLSVDLSDSDGRMATIEYAQSETRVFAGDYIDFDQFKFQNLRQIDGW